MIREWELLGLIGAGALVLLLLIKKVLWKE